MTYETEARLKSYLDTNQLSRERLCLALLKLDKRFSNVRPRHPHGGRDGGWDIDAVFDNSQKVAGAIGFMIGANDAPDQKRDIARKFKADAKSARFAKGGDSPPEFFAFFTNIDLTVTEERDLIDFARSKGFAACDIYDRERMRLALDDIDGLAARIQYLNIPLSEAEQASFFSRWGDDIQSVISTGFQRLERTLKRVLFLQEAEDVLGNISIHYELDSEYEPEEIGHFRAFCSFQLAEPKHKIFGILFGRSDDADRYSEERHRPKELGIHAGMCGPQWEHMLDFEAHEAAGREKDDEKWVFRGASSSVGAQKVNTIVAIYSHDHGFFRFQPRLRLYDLNDASFIHFLNASLAEKLAKIHVFANGYKLASYSKAGFQIDRTPFDMEIPDRFSQEELADPWVRIRGARSSSHSLHFSEWTPARFYEPFDISSLGEEGQISQ